MAGGVVGAHGVSVLPAARRPPGPALIHPLHAEGLLAPDRPKGVEVVLHVVGTTFVKVGRIQLTVARIADV